MAKLLKFRRRVPEPRGRRSEAGAKRHPGAEIMIFPGVRIERRSQRVEDRSHSLSDEFADSTGESA